MPPRRPALLALVQCERLRVTQPLVEALPARRWRRCCLAERSPGNRLPAAGAGAGAGAGADDVRSITAPVAAPVPLWVGSMSGLPSTCVQAAQATMPNAQATTARISLLQRKTERSMSCSHMAEATSRSSNAVERAPANLILDLRRCRSGQVHGKYTLVPESTIRSRHGPHFPRSDASQPGPSGCRGMRCRQAGLCVAIASPESDQCSSREQQAGAQETWAALVEPCQTRATAASVDRRQHLVEPSGRPHFSSSPVAVGSGNEG